jgi:hypothetical protein
MSAHVPADQLPPPRPRTVVCRVAHDAGDVGGPALSVLVAVLVLDDAGQVAEVVSPFASSVAARGWAELHGVARFELRPARLPGVADRG